MIILFFYKRYNSRCFKVLFVDFQTADISYIQLKLRLRQLQSIGINNTSDSIWDYPRSRSIYRIKKIKMGTTNAALHIQVLLYFHIQEFSHTSTFIFLIILITFILSINWHFLIFPLIKIISYFHIKQITFIYFPSIKVPSYFPHLKYYYSPPPPPPLVSLVSI